MRTFSYSLLSCRVKDCQCYLLIDHTEVLNMQRHINPVVLITLGSSVAADQEDEDEEEEEDEDEEDEDNEEEDEEDEAEEKNLKKMEEQRSQGKVRGPLEVLCHLRSSVSHIYLISSPAFSLCKSK